MRLIDVEGLELQYFDDADLPPYAILSHTWAIDSNDEVTSQEFHDPAIRSSKPGFDKITQCCRLAQEQGWKYVWIDTCCIDKQNIAELQTAINSMYAWYKQSQVCYAFLADREDDLADCRWFTRGWTLQELLAPPRIEFYDYRPGSAKLIDMAKYPPEELVGQISGITGIAECYLDGTRSVYEASVAERMSWVSRRRTTLIEDMAYCLLGLFNVSLPMLYGVGWSAFRRLQETIIAQSDDDSIFAWKAAANEGYVPRGMIASYPSEFADSGNIRRCNFHRTRPPYAVTNRGVEFHNPARSVAGLASRWMHQSTFNSMWNQVTEPFDLQLNCQDEHGRLIAITLAPDPATETFYRIQSSDWKTCGPESWMNRLAVLYGGYEKIYVKPPSLTTTTATTSSHVPQILREHATSLWHSTLATFSLDNFLLLVVQSFSCFYIPTTLLHSRRLPLEPLNRLNVFLGWAYLTLGWKVLGPSFYFWFGALAVGVVRPRPWSRDMALALLAPGMLGGVAWGVTQIRRLRWK